MSAVTERIVDAHLETGLRGQRENLLVAGDTFAVIDQYAYAHAALRGPQQGLDNQVARLIGAEYVRLNVERALRGVDHLDARRESIDTRRYHSKSRITAVALG